MAKLPQYTNMRILIPLLLFFAHALCAQPTCLPGSPVAANYPMTAEALKTLFETAQQKAELTPAAYEDLKNQINRCNNDMEVALSGIVSQMSELSLKYQQILGYKDVAGIEKQLRDLEESRKKSRGELEQNLGYVKHSGIFIVLLENVDFYKKEKKDLIAEANQAITGRAVEDLVGVHIRRSSEVKDFAPVRDVVQEIKDGEVRMEREYFNQSNHAKKHFLFVARTGATPARRKADGSTATGSGGLVLNLERDADFAQKLRERGVNEADIKRIEQEVVPFLPNVQRDNKTADGRQDYILQNGTEKIRTLDRDIEDARQRLKTRSGKIAEICKELNVSFNNSNFDQSVNAALQKIKDQFRVLSNQWNAATECEILYKDTRTFVEGSLSQSLAQEALKLCGQLEKGYGQLDRILQVTEVENLDVTKFENSRTVTVFRKPQKIWAYAIPRDDGSYGVVTFAQFKVTGQTTPDDGGGSSRQPYEPEMVNVESGKFQMGCTGEQGGDCNDWENPKHWVELDKYAIGKYEVTNEQFVAFLNDIASKITLNEAGNEVFLNGVSLILLSDRIKYSNGAWAGGTFTPVAGLEKHPVIFVSWDAVQEYCKWLNQKTNKKYRLPTEAEWEFAARGGNNSKGYKYAGGNDLGAVGWYDGNSGSNTHPVGEKKGNELGLFDMSGNMWEWCSDYWEDKYSAAAQTNPPGPKSGSNRVLRGGGWDRSARDCRVSYRGNSAPTYRGSSLGFRLASSPQ
jgi:formylglycine-generating enzyme required for sulfatase activity